MTQQTYPAEFFALLGGIAAQRAKTVIEHILEQGQIKTQALKNTRGHNHPPRAIRDIREQGIPLDMAPVAGSDGRKIAVYEFGAPTTIRAVHRSGRSAFAAKPKDALIEKHGAGRTIYPEPFPIRELTTRCPLLAVPLRSLFAVAPNR